MSTARTEAAPAEAAAIATSPEPEARSSTRLPATSAGWSRTYRASACPPAQANAQNGGGCSLRNSPSVSSHSPIGSSAWCSRISGTQRHRREPAVQPDERGGQLRGHTDDSACTPNVSSIQASTSAS